MENLEQQDLDAKIKIHDFQSNSPLREYGFRLKP